MNWLKRNNLARLKNTAWSVALLVVVTTMSAVPRSSAQAMQKGISVELAPTSSAVPVPDADNPDALIITVTDSGKLYFGIDPVTPGSLAEKLKGRMSRSHAESLYQGGRQGALRAGGEGLGCGAYSRCCGCDPADDSTEDAPKRERLYLRKVLKWSWPGVRRR